MFLYLSYGPVFTYIVQYLLYGPVFSSIIMVLWILFYDPVFSSMFYIFISLALYSPLWSTYIITSMALFSHLWSCILLYGPVAPVFSKWRYLSCLRHLRENLQFIPQVRLVYSLHTGILALHSSSCTLLY